MKEEAWTTAMGSRPLKYRYLRAWRSENSERSVTAIIAIDMVNELFTVANKPNLYGVI